MTLSVPIENGIVQKKEKKKQLTFLLSIFYVLQLE